MVTLGERWSSVHGSDTCRVFFWHWDLQGPCLERCLVVLGLGDCHLPFPVAVLPSFFHNVQQSLSSHKRRLAGTKPMTHFFQIKALPQIVFNWFAYLGGFFETQAHLIYGVFCLFVLWGLGGRWKSDCASGRQRQTCSRCVLGVDRPAVKFTSSRLLSLLLTNSNGTPVHQLCNLSQLTREACKHVVILAIIIPQPFMSPWENIFCLAKIHLLLLNIKRRRRRKRYNSPYGVEVLVWAFFLVCLFVCLSLLS